MKAPSTSAGALDASKPPTSGRKSAVRPAAIEPKPVIIGVKSLRLENLQIHRVRRFLRPEESIPCPTGGLVVLKSGRSESAIAAMATVAPNHDETGNGTKGRSHGGSAPQCISGY